MPTPIVTLQNVSKTFKDAAGTLTVLQNIELKIQPGEFFVMVGPSGSGKSTLLRIMSGLEPKYRGIVTWAEGLTPGDFSFVFQQFALLPWLTVAGNIEIGLRGLPISPAERQARIRRELKRFGLEQFGTAYPRALSGGMMQRVGMARALARDPKVIFMDEPFSELDSFTAEKLRQEFLAIWNHQRPTIVMVTHIVAEAIELADRVAVLTPRPGRLEQVVKNPLLRPRSRRSAEFFDLEDKLQELIKP